VTLVFDGEVPVGCRVVGHARRYARLEHYRITLEGAKHLLADAYLNPLSLGRHIGREEQPSSGGIRRTNPALIQYSAP
jgi:hypothetical protein